MIIILHGISTDERLTFINLFKKELVQFDDSGEVYIYDKDELLIVKIYPDGCITLYPNKSTAEVLGALRSVLP